MQIFSPKADDDKQPLKKGAVQKLVLKGRWEDRRWNDRWLELDADEIRYCWEEGKPIDRMKAECIQCMSMLNPDTAETKGHENKSNAHLILESTSIWNIVLAHRHDFSELSTCFLLATTSKESAGREYLLRTTSPSETLEWVREISSIIDDARPPPETVISRIRGAVFRVYHSPPFRVLVLFLIALNFSAFIYDTQACCPSPAQLPHTNQRQPPPLNFSSRSWMEGGDESTGLIWVGAGRDGGGGWGGGVGWGWGGEKAA